jgi:acyl phosphate:glycerol-3-phosphate acyltransferase
MAVPLLIALVVGYLLGSLPFGYLVARAKGVNIFEVGSKSPGATNVRRVLGNGPGNLVLFLDALKGVAAAGWPLWFGRLSDEVPHGAVTFFPAEHVSSAAVAGLFGALLGHSFSCFTGFRGGKGVATGAGGLFVLFPIGVAIALGLWLVVLALTRYASLASMLAAVSLPISAFALHRSTLMISVCGAVAVFVVIRHRANISRLLAGTESKSGQKAEIAK